MAGLALDLDGRRIYWTNSIAALVRSAPLDGGDVETILGNPDVFIPLGIAFDGRGLHDADNDGDVDLVDFRCFQICYGASPEPSHLNPWCQVFDADENGDVNLPDFIAFYDACQGASSR